MKNTDRLSVQQIILISLFFFVCNCKENKSESCKLINLLVGETAIKLNIYQTGQTRTVYFNMHDDENTAVEAVERFISERGGYFVELEAQGNRLIEFKLNEKEFSFDPNRIFTDTGIRKTLSTQNTEAPYREIRRFVDTLFTFLFIDSVKTIVSVHNNAEGSYSILSYVTGESLENDAREYHINPQMDTDDFYFVTERKLFTLLRDHNQNVVLQDNESVNDDGSLSVYCGRHSIPYINVETQHGHLEEQVRMLHVLRNLMLTE